MHTSATLLDIHERAHHNLRAVLAHCAGLDEAALVRELAGFGYPTIRRQIHHVVGAEEYWVGVLHGRVEADDDDTAYPTIAALEAYLARVSAETGRYLRGATPEELNTPRSMMTWGGRERVLIPAEVVLRTVTHAYHHVGQVSAMCRLLGLPAEAVDLNYPIG